MILHLIPYYKIIIRHHQSDDDFVIKSKYYSLIYSSCFESYLEFSKMSLLFGMCSFLYFLNLSAGRGF